MTYLVGGSLFRGFKLKWGFSEMPVKEMKEKFTCGTPANWVVPYCNLKALTLE